MKIFQIVNSLCWWDATATVKTIEQAHEMFSPDCLFVEAPDYVFEGWGYDEHAEGDERFIRPETPEGYEYDERTGTFYPTDNVPALMKGAAKMSDEDRLAELISRMTAILEEAETILASMKSDEPEKEVKK